AGGGAQGRLVWLVRRMSCASPYLRFLAAAHKQEVEQQRMGAGQPGAICGGGRIRLLLSDAPLLHQWAAEVLLRHVLGQYRTRAFAQEIAVPDGGVECDLPEAGVSEDAREVAADQPVAPARRLVLDIHVFEVPNLRARRIEEAPDRVVYIHQHQS